jgi:hypothetical protein
VRSLTRSRHRPSYPPLRQAVHWIVRLSGFLGRRGDDESGVTVLWKGFQQLRSGTGLQRSTMATLPQMHLPTSKPFPFTEEDGSHTPPSIQEYLWELHQQVKALHHHGLTLQQ